MTISERILEDNEAKIDNILHKITKATEHIKKLGESIDDDTNDKNIISKSSKIQLLAETIENLTILADEIDLENEKITHNVGERVTQELNIAIERIQDAAHLLSKESKNQ